MTRRLRPERLQHFTASLEAERADALERLAGHRAGMIEVRAARADGSADDEHDPDGPTMSQEWSQRSAVLVDAEHELADIERALARIAAGTYGVCARCGGEIAVARLDARPTAELCIECARARR